MQLSNKIILITGASSGMGRAFALAISKRSNKIIVTARRKEKLDSLKEEIERNGSECLSIAGDSLKDDFAEKVIEEAVSYFGKIDIALLNAGGGRGEQRTDRISEKEVIESFDTNFKTHVNYLFPLIAHMRTLPKAIIAHTNSMSKFVPVPGMGPYGAAKNASSYLMDVCRIELSKTNIKFLNIYPGFVASNGPRDEVPVQALVIDNDRAVKEFIHAIEKEKQNYLFPKRLALLIRIAGLLPKSAVTSLMKKMVK